MPEKKIIGLTFPENNEKLGLEPSILNVLPQGDNVDFSVRNIDFPDAEVDRYLCSVYISGMHEFEKWAMKHDTRKIIVGGYHPTMFPEKFLNFADKIIQGPCDDIAATLDQETLFEKGYYDNGQIGNSRFVPGKLLKTLEPISNQIRTCGEMKKGKGDHPSGKSEVLQNRIFPGLLTFQHPPRRDLYDILGNQQIIPDKQTDDLSASVNTSFGCHHACDFCCTPPMFGRRLISKPIESVDRESQMVKDDYDKADPANEKQRFLFVRDENFTLQKDFKERLKTIAENTKAKIYMFASADTLTEAKVRELARNNVYMVCLGLENPDQTYKKNKNLDQAVGLLKKHGIQTYLSFIANPLEIVGAQKGVSFYDRLFGCFQQLKPEMVCGNFLMPFPGTPLWDEFYHLVSEDDFQHYDSKTPFLIKNELVRAKMKYFMFEIQHRYLTSTFYKNNVRTFETGDTLYSRFLELKEEFDISWSRVKALRP
jgi:radical SAM superfamily enzyme YgiQ (UPF0313 family)